MKSIYILPAYAAALSFLFLCLAIRVLKLRRALKIPLGDGQQPQLLRAMRTHANFAEYVPLSLMLLLLVETRVDLAILIHFLNACLLVGRCAHAYGVSQENENYRFRVTGMLMTFACISGCATTLLYSYVMSH